MKKADIIKTLEKRAEHFDSTHHSYESREIWSAIDVIERLMPPELFSIPVVVDTLVCDDTELDCPFDFTSKCTIGRCNCKVF
jgi:hypothetical protein